MGYDIHDTIHGEEKDEQGNVIRTFYSQGEASRFGFDQRLISRAIRKGFRHKGYFWKEVMQNEDDS